MKNSISDDLRPISDFAKPGSNGYKRTYNRAKKFGALVLIGDIPYILMSKYSNAQLEDLKPQDESAKIEFHIKKYQKIRTIAKVSQIINKIQEGLVSCQHNNIGYFIDFRSCLCYIYANMEVVDEKIHRSIIEGGT